MLEFSCLGKNISGRVTVPVDDGFRAAENIRNPGSAFLLLRREEREAGCTYIAFEGLEPSDTRRKRKRYGRLIERKVRSLQFAKV